MHENAADTAPPAPVGRPGASSVRLATTIATSIGMARTAVARAIPSRPEWTAMVGERSATVPTGRRHQTPTLPLPAGSASTCRVARAAVRPLVSATLLVGGRPFDEEWFEHRGLRLRFEVHGTGPNVVVLTHGLLLDSQMNRRLADDLAERGNRVVLLDLPGHGRSDRPRHATAHRMDIYASSVVALLDHLGTERAIVGGVSLGANVSLHVAEIAPERVAALILEMPVLELAVPAAAAAFIPMLMAIRAGAVVLRPVTAAVRRLPRTQIGVIDSFVAAAASDPDEVAAVLHGVLTGPVAPAADARRAMEMPALVIGHQIDAIHPFADAVRLAHAMPHARLVRARSIAELRFAPARLTASIAGFVDEVWAAQPAGDATSQQRPGTKARRAGARTAGADRTEARGVGRGRARSTPGSPADGGAAAAGTT